MARQSPGHTDVVNIDQALSARGISCPHPSLTKQSLKDVRCIRTQTQANALIQLPIHATFAAPPRPRSSSKENAVSISTLAPARYTSSHVDAAASARQLPLPLSWEVSPGVPAVPPVPRHLHLVGTPESRNTEATGAHLPAVEWVARMARAVAEVGSGERPSGQLTRWVERDQLRLLAARGAAVARHPSSRARVALGSKPRALQQVRSIRLCPISTGIVETSAVLVGAERARAVAMRFEFTSERWLLTAFSLG